MKSFICASSVVGAVLLIACSSSSECENARNTAVQAIESVCKTRPSSPFCSKCAAAKYHSYRVEQGNCVCRHLVYDAAACWYPVDGQDVAAANGAIEQADRACNAFLLPTEVELTTKDAGGGG